MKVRSKSSDDVKYCFVTARKPGSFIQAGSMALLSKYLKLTTVVVCCVLLLLLVIFIPLFGHAVPAGGTDMGKLYLAASTQMLRGEAVTVTQRAPLYSLVLAAVGSLMGVDVSVSSSKAREMGSLETLEVADSLLGESFLSVVLWVQFALWLCTGLFSFLTLRKIKVAPTPLLLGLPGFLVLASWFMIGFVHDAVLTQFLISVGVFGFVWSAVNPQRYYPIIVAAIAFALVGLSRPTYQLVSPFIAVGMFFPLRHVFERTYAARFSITLLVAWCVFAGGWSLRNYSEFGFFGVSSAYGIGLSTKTALYVERAAETYPTETEAFIQIRNYQLTSLPEHTASLWGAGAAQWLTANRNMSYVEANNFLLNFNLAAISSAPLRYVSEVAKSFVGFHLPVVSNWTNALRILPAIVESAYTLAFWGLIAVFVSGLILIRFRELPHAPSRLETLVVLFSLGLFLYTAVVSSAIDLGKPDHRIPVQFLIPLTIAVVAHWMSSLKAAPQH